MPKHPRPNKDLGQHFLKDQKVIDLITSDFADECDVIIEVGPGPAILTKSLSLHDKPLFIIEKDERFRELIETCVSKENIYFTDALKFQWEEFLDKNNLRNKKIWLVSNLPYNISAPLFLSFTKVKEINFLSLMFQKEVGEKTYVKDSGKSKMSSLLSISLNYFQPEMLCKVLPGAFNPPPKVDSVVVSYKRKDNPVISIKDFRAFEVFLRELHQFRRKQLGSVLKRYIKQQPSFFEKSGVDRERRAETLSMQEVYKLYENSRS